MRELENLLHRAVALCDGDTLQLDDLQSSCNTGAAPLAEEAAIFNTPQQAHTFSPTFAPTDTLPSDLQNHLDQQEREILVKCLKETNFNRTLAAARLGLSLRQIRYRIARLKIDAPRDEDPDA